MTYEAILFDFDGVIVDSMGNYAKAWVTACGRVGISADEMEMYRREGEKEDVSAKYFIRASGMMSTKARVRELVRIMHEEFSMMPRPNFFPGAQATVEVFKSVGFKTGLVTGAVCAEVEAMLPPDFKDLFDVIVCGDEVMRGKPNPEPYLMATMRLGIDPAKTVVVENAPFGIESAKKAGTFVVGVRSYLSDEDLAGASAFVDDIRQLPKLLLED